MDAFILKAIVAELGRTLKGARVAKVSQPRREVLILEFSLPEGEKSRLLLSAESEHPRLHLTAREYPSPPQPPSFCMSMRKHLEGARFTGAAIRGLERVVQLSFDRRDHVGRVVRHALMVEVMGRHSNLILLDGRTGLILDSIKLIGKSLSRERQILRNLPYRLPPAQQKEDPLLIEREAFEALAGLGGRTPPSPDRVAARLVKGLGGLSPALAEEVVARVPGERRWEGLWEAFREVMDLFREGRFEPTLLLDPMGQLPEDISAIAPRRLPPSRQRRTATMNEAADLFYGDTQLRQGLVAERRRLQNVLSQAIARKRKVLRLLERDLRAGERAGECKLKADLLLANLDRVEVSAKEVTLLWDAGEVTIALDPTLNPAENAQRYYRRYKKLKRLRTVGERRQESVSEEVGFLEGLEYDLSQAAGPEDFGEVRRLLEEEGFLKERKEDAKGAGALPGRGDGGRPGPLGAPRPARPYRRFVTEEGWELLVGKNSRGNDLLARESAGRGLLWFHAQDLPGAHVVLKPPDGRGEPPEEMLRRAAVLAAYFSKGRGGTKVPVDYLPLKDLRRPKGARPGRVTYTGQKTLLVRPEEVEEVLRGLSERE
ncbi:MAG: NFACT family protein [Nitrospinota bacterium]